MTLDTLELIAVCFIVGPWAVLVAVILYARSFGQYSEKHSEEAKRDRAYAEIVRNAQQHELDLLRQNVDSLKRLVIARDELEHFKREKSA